MYRIKAEIYYCFLEYKTYKLWLTLIIIKSVE